MRVVGLGWFRCRAHVAVQHAQRVCICGAEW